jgi:hypothetical protein
MRKNKDVSNKKVLTEEILGKIDRPRVERTNHLSNTPHKIQWQTNVQHSSESKTSHRPHQLLTEEIWTCYHQLLCHRDLGAPMPSTIRDDCVFADDERKTSHNQKLLCLLANYQVVHANNGIAPAWPVKVLAHWTLNQTSNCNFMNKHEHCSIEVFLNNVTKFVAESQRPVWKVTEQE